MTAIGVLPESEHKPGSKGDFLTFVVPSPSGCNLGCSFCLVQQRREIGEDQLGPGDLSRFIQEAAERGPIFAIAIQGYEPLLEDSFPYTRAVLAIGRKLGLPTALVTNGVLLYEAVDRLAAFGPSTIAISLDSDSAGIHDRVRGAPGGWAATIRGIKRAVETLAPDIKLVVSSVLLPSKCHYLEGIPALLKDMGVDKWIVNPLLRCGSDGVGGPVGNRRSLFQDLLHLHEVADRSNVHFTVDDELDRLAFSSVRAQQPELGTLNVRSLPPGIDIFRLAPSGRCSVGQGILKQMTPDVRQWRPSAVNAGDFLDTIRRCEVDSIGQTFSRDTNTFSNQISGLTEAPL
jgi:pyruvate-formate lyase-activating enzyme